MDQIKKGAVVGLIGGGQLGKMFSEAAHKLGYRVICLDPDPKCCCAKVADQLIVAKYSDQKAIEELSKKTQVITYEFENVDANILEKIEKQGAKVFPSSKVLRTTQNRIHEKEFVNSLKIPVTEFAKITSVEQVPMQVKKIGLPAIIKTADGGYDGKGQVVVKTLQEAKDGANELFQKSRELIYEKMIELEKEVSIICAREIGGKIIVYPTFENTHKENILFTTICPAKISKEQEKTAREYGRIIGEKLEIVGTYCIEMFIEKGGKLLVNEIAPRPHNSGHLTIEATNCSQFESQVRAICNIELIEPELTKPAAMINILGENRGNKIKGVEKIPKDGFLHIYGKIDAKEKRKMGHITILGENALEKAIKARNEIYWSKE